MGFNNAKEILVVSVTLFIVFGIFFIGYVSAVNNPIMSFDDCGSIIVDLADDYHLDVCESDMLFYCLHEMNNLDYSSIDGYCSIFVL